MGVILQFVLVCFLGVTWGRIFPPRTIMNPSSTTSSISTSVPTSTTTYPPNVTVVTLAPGKKINYTLVLQNNGPAVLDAKITFTAQLLDKRGKVSQSTEFKYDWNNNADQSFHMSEGDLESSYVYDFKSSETKSGSWVMTVAVYSGKEHEEIVNFGSMQFTLTDTLNGALHPIQTLDYQRDPNTFSAYKDIMLIANHTDNLEYYSPKFTFFWYKNSDFVRATQTPHLNLSMFEEGNFTLEVEMYANFDEIQAIKRRLGDRPTKNSCQENMRRQFRKHIDEKCGSFSRQVVIKKPLTSVDILGDRSAELGEYISVNVTCRGSFPSSVCWNMTALNSSAPSLNYTCEPEQFVNSCNHVISIKLTELGWKTVWFTVYNDVSYLSTPFNVYAYDPHSVNVPALTIPIVFCVLGGVVVLIGSLYLNRLRKKPTIEVADFDFHPSVSDDSPNLLYRLANKIKTTWHRNKHMLSRDRGYSGPRFESDNTDIQRPDSGTKYRETTAKRYGSLSEYEQL